MSNNKYNLITIKLDKNINDFLDYLQENFTCSKEDYINKTIKRDVLSRMYDLKNFSFP